MSAPQALPLATHRTKSEARWLAPLVLALAVVATRAIWLGDPAADYDEQLYSLIGLRWLDGALPYADLWDRKPAGLFALFAMAHAVGGPPFSWSSHLVEQLARHVIPSAKSDVSGE